MTEHPLKAYREQQGLSMAAFAAMAETTEATISRVESGKLQPTTPLLKRLIAATGGTLSANDIIYGAEAAN